MKCRSRNCLYSGVFNFVKLIVHSLGKNANDPNKVVLEEGTDYTVEYSNNVKSGKATIILNAKENSGNCFGSRTHNFNIVKGIMRWVK